MNKYESKYGPLPDQYSTPEKRYAALEERYKRAKSQAEWYRKANEELKRELRAAQMEADGLNRLWVDPGEEEFETVQLVGSNFRRIMALIPKDSDIVQNPE